MIFKKVCVASGATQLNQLLLAKTRPCIREEMSYHRADHSPIYKVK